MGSQDFLALALAIVILLLLGLVGSGQLEPFLADRVWLDIAAAAVGNLGGLLGILFADILFTNVLRPGKTPDLVEALLGILCSDGVGPVRMVLHVAVSTNVPRSDHFVFTRKTYVVSQDQSAVVAHRLQDLLDLYDES